MRSFISTLLIATTFMAVAQRENHVDLTYGTGQGTQCIAGHVVKNFVLLKNDQLRLGIGGRALYNFGSDISYTSAPAKYANNAPKVDTVIAGNTHIITTNLSLNAAWMFTPKLAVGCNVDLLGFSFGPKVSADFFPGESSQSLTPPRTKTSDNTLRPSKNNFYLFGNNNRGNLSSEVFIRYNVHERFSIKAGYRFMINEYSATSRIGFNDNYRFRNRSGQIMAGIGFHFI